MTALLFIALSLSMDAFAVSVSSGISIRRETAGRSSGVHSGSSGDSRSLRFFYAIRASFFFGLFQFLMPLAGWSLGSAFMVYIESFDHWIAFLLLAFIGGKMLAEAFRQRGKSGGGESPSSGETAGGVRSLKTLLLLAVATSIDALAAGISLSIMGHGVWLSAAVIGGVTFLVCLCGFEFGRRIGYVLEKWAQAAGGIILIAIGIKILLQHLAA